MLALAAAVVAGCGDVPREAGFGDVAATVATRQAGPRVVWRRGGREEAEADQAVVGLLSGTLRSDVAVQVALLNNRRLQATYESLMVSQAEVVSAGLLRNPVFDGVVRYREGGGGHVGMDFGVAIDFLSVFQIPLRSKIAKANFAGAKANVAAAVLDLSAEVRRAYVDALAAQQEVGLRGTALDADRAAAKVARKLREAGNIIERDAAMREATAAQSELELSEAKAGLALARERLAALMGLESSAFKLPEELPGYAASAVGDEAGALDASLGLAAARARVDAAARQLSLAKGWGLWPGAEAGVATERDSDSRKWETGPSFSLPIPLFDQGQAAAATSAAELRRARAEYSAEAVELRAAYRAGVAKAEAKAGAARHMEEVVVPLRVKITRETQLQYNAMQVGAFELLEARRQQVEAGIQAIHARRDALEAQSELNLLLAGGTPRGLMEVGR